MKKALDKVLDTVYEALIRNKTEWVIMGSLATYLQGINLVPGDIDILVKCPEDVYYFAELMTEYAIEKCETRVNHHDIKWQSSLEVPVAADEPNPAQAVWYFGRWYVNNFKVEVAHIVPPTDYMINKKPEAGIWEGGPEVWPYIKHVDYKGYLLPVLPLEIQLETNLRRNLDSRISKIISLFKENHYNNELLEKSLSHKNLLRFNNLIRK